MKRIIILILIILLSTSLFSQSDWILNERAQAEKELWEQFGKLPPAGYGSALNLEYRFQFFTQPEYSDNYSHWFFLNGNWEKDGISAGIQLYSYYPSLRTDEGMQQARAEGQTS